MTSETSINVMQRHLLTIEKLRNRVRQMLKCVINLHIEFLVLESNVNTMMDEVKSFNEELLEVQRLDALISALRDYSGPTICHEWPYPLIFKGTIDDADVAQILNGRKKVDKSNNNNINKRNINCEVRCKSAMNSSTNHQLSDEVT
ncbi:uncharacterized protein LOC126762494 isoform X1 [Bactrocera neohumeralis]|uniref:uncharacterized protein LOC120776706 isoform X1 n=1 Tax=Bactrocera tryoni TaxID=59916 RepID=UPI001A993EDB|nr:uncharacterized protein LOC120776706 isoform X1 [Bactrocera tryoni]XP_050335233.1 uncharacterized protein LOC126762494 isoform X1 [Bactrocera neohumeralis]XP_050335234.1 uncharacterized protein LOC126762494 isoform X1 [Bactrocera neohumeralis]